ncbi:MAG: hypothetical protein ACR2IH_01830 [Pyrinomonadaceae bacterium]
MKNYILFLLTIAVCVSVTFGQARPEGPSAAGAKTSDLVAENALAKLVYSAHGGEKLKNLKSLVVRGTVDTTMSAFPQAIPGGFSMVIAGDKYIIDMQNAMQSFKQVFDGKETFCSIHGFELPPLTSVGFPLLQRFGSPGYVVSALPAGKKKKGFRMTAPDAAYTDFYVDEKTNQISGYESSFEVNGNKVSTSAVVDRYRIVDGIPIPEKYSQRFDLGQITAYADFKAKEILINKELDDNVFAIGK